jgi:hypothetical protein
MASKFLLRFQKTKYPSSFITVVSGLPRSGTSMMMQILQAGGMEILTDYVRGADDDNPKGYYEFERVKKLKEGDNLWLADAQGKAVKIVSSLLEYLPEQYSYKIIFMQRDMSEILASQKQMLIRRGEPTDKASDEIMAGIFQQHLSGVQTWLSGKPNLPVLYIQYTDLLKNPKANVDEVVRYLSLPLKIQPMYEVPDAKLYRQRN